MDHEQVYSFQRFFEIGSKFFLPIFFAAGSCLATSFDFYYPLLLVLGPDCCLQLHLRKRILHSFTLIQYGFLSLKLKNSFQRSRLMMAYFSSNYLLCILFRFCHLILGTIYLKFLRFLALYKLQNVFLIHILVNFLSFLLHFLLRIDFLIFNKFILMNKFAIITLPLTINICWSNILAGTSFVIIDFLSFIKVSFLQNI